MWVAGNDLNEDITPIEAGLKWTIGKSRRDKCDFLGGEVSHLLELHGMMVENPMKTTHVACDTPLQYTIGLHQ